MACASAGYSVPRFLTYRQAQELGGQVRKGEHGHKVYFVKRLVVKDKNKPEEDDDAERIVPMMREYTVFNVSQVDGLPDRVLSPGQVKPRNDEERDATSTSSSRPLTPKSTKGSVKPSIGRLPTSSRCRASSRSRSSLRPTITAPCSTLDRPQVAPRPRSAHPVR
jgi:N-terminal domain of anti-restriction factor ArdC